MSTDQIPNPDDPVEWFRQELKYMGRASSSLDNYVTTARRIEEFAADPEFNGKGRPLSLSEVTPSVARRWKYDLDENPDLGEKSVAKEVQNAHRFFGFMASAGIFDANPFTKLLDEVDTDTTLDDPTREVSIDEMAEFLHSIGDPFRRAINWTLCKTGMRASELANLDVQDINIEYPTLDDEYEPTRSQLTGRPDTIYVPTLDEGDVVNGEERLKGNKRKRGTLIPIDDELKEVLLRWLMVRPDAKSSANPLFTNANECWGERVTYQQVYRAVIKEAERYGWWEEGGGRTANVTPHFYRHFFTTNLRMKSNDDMLVRYLRGDKGDILEEYTHNWGTYVRDKYEQHIYTFTDV